MSNNRWTIKELNETDDLTFAMCILSERRGMLNQEAPLAKKLAKAYHTIEKLRDICRENPQYRQGIIGERQAIHLAVEREFMRDDIIGRIEDSSDNDVDLYGMEPAVVLADKEIMERITEKLDSSDCNSGYWDNVDNAIENAIKELLEERKGGEVNP